MRFAGACSSLSSPTITKYICLKFTIMNFTCEEHSCARSPVISNLFNADSTLKLINNSASNDRVSFIISIDSNRITKIVSYSHSYTRILYNDYINANFQLFKWIYNNEDLKYFFLNRLTPDELNKLFF